MLARINSRDYLWFIIGLAAILRGAQALRRPLQVDEGLSLFLAGHPLAYALQYLRTLDVHPPLFAIVLHGLVLLHLPDAALRMISAGIGVTSVMLLYFIVRLWSGPTAALVAAAIAAVMPSLIYYDSMLRMYVPFDAVVLAQFLLLTLLLTHGDWSTRARRLLWMGWTLAVAIACYLLYLGWIVAAAQLLYAAVVRRDAVVRAATGSAVAFVAWLPQMPTFLRQLPAGGLAFPWIQAHPLQAMVSVPAQATIATQLAGPFADAAVGVSLIWLALAFWAAIRYAHASFIAALGLPAVLTLLISVLSAKALYVDRYYLLLAYALAAWSGVAVAVALRRAPRTAGIAFAIGFVILCAFGAQRAFNPMYYTADWPAVARVLAAQAKPKDALVLEQGSPAYILAREGALNGNPTIVIFRHREIAQALDLVARVDRVWLISYQEQPVDPRQELAGALKLRRHLGGAWAFYRALPAENVVVRLFVK